MPKSTKGIRNVNTKLLQRRSENVRRNLAEALDRSGKMLVDVSRETSIPLPTLSRIRNQGRTRLTKTVAQKLGRALSVDPASWTQDVARYLEQVAEPINTSPVVDQLSRLMNEIGRSAQDLDLATALARNPQLRGDEYTVLAERVRWKRELLNKASDVLDSSTAGWLAEAIMMAYRRLS